MAIKDIVKGICNVTRCKYDVYTKERTDELFKVKGDFAVVTGEITMENATGKVIVNYPDGFNKDNTVVISYGQTGINSGGPLDAINFGFGVHSLDYMSGSLPRNVALTSTNIEISIRNPLDDTAGSRTYNYKIVLMKIS